MLTYHIQVSGAVDVNELNGMSPVQMAPLSEDEDHTRFTICTDQAGLLGLLRHLHNLGLRITDVRAQSAGVNEGDQKTWETR